MAADDDHPNPNPKAMGWPVLGCSGLWRLKVDSAEGGCRGWGVRISKLAHLLMSMSSLNTHNQCFYTDKFCDHRMWSVWNTENRLHGLNQKNGSKWNVNAPGTKDHDQRKPNTLKLPRSKTISDMCVDHEIELYSLIGILWFMLYSYQVSYNMISGSRHVLFLSVVITVSCAVVTLCIVYASCPRQKIWHRKFINAAGGFKLIWPDNVPGTKEHNKTSQTS